MKNNRWTKENLEKCVENSTTFREIIEKLGLKVGASSYHSLKFYIEKYEIDFKFDYVKDHWQKENLSKIIVESVNHTDVLIKMSLIPHGCNFKTLNKYIKKYNIDISHFDSFYKRSKFGKKEKTKLSDVLIENSNYDRGELKRRLFEENLKKRRCELCGQDENWNGRKMSLILDHINGVNNDNRIENLQIICPNCNSTLDTFAGRNIESKKPKCSCGNVISYKSKKCRNCQDRDRRKIERPDKEDLLKQVESSNYTEVGKKYGVSRSTIRRWIHGWNN